jgi:hypothetical protein
MPEHLDFLYLCSYKDCYLEGRCGRLQDQGEPFQVYIGASSRRFGLTSFRDAFQPLLADENGCMTIRILPSEMQALIELAQKDTVSISVPTNQNLP